MKNKNKKAFTLIEMLAVVVILAIVLVISIPAIVNTIVTGRVNVMESSAKIIANQIEKDCNISRNDGSAYSSTGNCMNTGNLDSDEYESCTYTVDSNCKSKVTLVGKNGGKFASYTVTDATKFDALAVYDYTCTPGYTRIGTTSIDSKCNVNLYTVSFDTNGGIGTFEDVTVTYDEIYGDALPLPERSGYTFVGWYTARNGGTLIEKTDTVKILENTTLYAHWTANIYAVTISAGTGATIPETSGWTVSNDGITATKELTYDGSYGVLPEPTKPGYTFNGWYLDSLYQNKVEDNSIVVSSTNHMLYAKWTANSYAITFDVNGGNSTHTNITVTYDKTYGTLPTPERTGYTFYGWYTLSSGGTLIENTSTVKITENTTLYAHWTASCYTVTVSGGAGSVITTTDGWTNASDNTSATKVLTYDSAYGTLPSATKTGYTFNGWYLDSLYQTKIEENTIIQSSTNHMLYAKWVVNSYTLTVDLNNGTCTECASSGSRDYGTVVSLGTPSRTGYTFNGWTITSGTSTLSSSNLTIGASDVTVKANWTANKYTITYDANGGTGSMEQSTHYYDTASNLTSNVFTRASYDFKGWNTKADGTGTSYTNNAQILNLTPINDGNITLYAEWEITVQVYFHYSGSFNCNGSSLSNTTCSITSTDWKVKFLTSGSLTIYAIASNTDIFCVGGGAGGAGIYHSNEDNWGAGGGGGYTATKSDVTLSANGTYAITVGAGGGPASSGGASSFSNILSANGGSPGYQSYPAAIGGSGGSAGGGGNYHGSAGYGGSNGGTSNFNSGSSQGTTTREFGESSGTLYSGGGGGFGSWCNGYSATSGSGGSGGGGAYGKNGTANTGGGGGAGSTSGGSGIVVMRDHR